MTCLFSEVFGIHTTKSGYAHAGNGGFVALVRWTRSRRSANPERSERAEEEAAKENGLYQAHCANRRYVPETQWSSCWNTLPFQRSKWPG